jgi:hypothetical protein
VDEDDLLTRIQRRGRLYGRSQSRRAVCAVVESLGECLSARAYQMITAPLPDEIRRLLTRPAALGREPSGPTCRAFLARLGTRLCTDGPDVPFLARVVLEELNAARRVITPVAFAHLVAPDLRPLLSARPTGGTAGEPVLAPRRIIRVPSAPGLPATPGRLAAPGLPAAPGRLAAPVLPAAPDRTAGRVVA